MRHIKSKLTNKQRFILLGLPQSRMTVITNLFMLNGMIICTNNHMQMLKEIQDKTFNFHNIVQDWDLLGGLPISIYWKEFYDESYIYLACKLPWHDWLANYHRWYLKYIADGKLQSLGENRTYLFTKRLEILSNVIDVENPQIEQYNSYYDNLPKNTIMIDTLSRNSLYTFAELIDIAVPPPKDDSPEVHPEDNVNFPKLSTQAMTYWKSRKQWKSEGSPVRSPERVAEIYDEICTKCPFFYNDRCKLCGCGIKREGTFLNKLAWATTRCPDIPPKWVEEEGFQPKSVESKPCCGDKKGPV